MAASDLMRKALGDPDPATPFGLTFANRAAEIQWEATLEDFPAGWFRNRFLYFLGPRLEALQPCLAAWSWLVKPNPDRVIIGRNAYGAIAYCEGMNAGSSMVHILDPLTLTRTSDDGMDIVGFFARYVPQGLLPHFLDSSAYDRWLPQLKKPLGLDRILAIKRPLPLDGTMDPTNFQIEDIVEYYQTTAKIYGKHHAAATDAESKRKAAGKKKPTRRA
jgi:hypothetical protein